MKKVKTVLKGLISFIESQDCSYSPDAKDAHRIAWEIWFKHKKELSPKDREKIADRLEELQP